MTLASTATDSFRAVRETTYGVTPTPDSSNKALVLPLSGESLSYDIKREAPSVIHADRAALNLSTLSASVTGGIDMDMSAQPVVDELLSGLMQGSWSSTKAASSISVTGVALTGGKNVLTVASHNLAVGQFLLLTSAVAGYNNKLLQVFSTTATEITVTTGALAAGTPANTKATSRRLTHGSTVNTYSIGKLNEAAGVSEVYTGLGVGSVDISTSAASKSTFKATFVGATMVVGDETVPLFAATGTAVQELLGTAGFHTSVSGSASTVLVDGQTGSSSITKSLNLSINNNLRIQERIFAGLVPAGVGNGELAVTGSLEVYMTDASWFEKYTANSDVSLSFTSLDESNNGYVFTLPRAKLSKVNAPASGSNQDRMIKIDFTATLDTSHVVGSPLRKALFIDQVGQPS